MSCLCPASCPVHGLTLKDADRVLSEFKSSLGNVISIEAKRQDRAAAQLRKCGDGCSWAVPSFNVHGHEGPALKIVFPCPLCGVEYTADVP